MNNYSDALISISLDRQAEKVSMVQAYGSYEPQPGAGRRAFALVAASLISVLVLVIVGTSVGPSLIQVAAR